MIELILRIVASGGLAAFGVYLGQPIHGIFGQIALGYFVTSVVVYLFERRALRGPWMNTAFGLGDLALVAYGLHLAKQFASLGFLAVLPPILLARYHRLHPAMIGTLGSLLLAYVGMNAPGMSLVSLGGFVAFAWVALWIPGPKTESVVEIREVEVPVPMTQTDRGTEVVSKATLELRDNYRSLRDAYKNLERKARKDRICALLFDAASSQGDRMQQRLAHKMRDLTGVTGLSLFTAVQYSDAMAVRAVSGDLPEAMTTRAVSISRAVSESQVRVQFDLWLKAIRSDDHAPHARSLVLKDRDRVIGVLCLSDPSPEKLQKGMELAEEAAPILARYLREEHELDLLRARVKQVETLYLLSTITAGAETPTTLAARVVRELFPTLLLDHFAIHMVDGENSLLVATEGTTAALFDHVQFGSQMGLPGWLASECPEAVLFDTTDDDRVDRKDALQRRVGSYAVIPIRFAEEPFGFLTAATHRVGGIDLPLVETLRIIGTEVAHALARLEEAHGDVSGFCSPREFQHAITQADSGSLVLLEPLHRDALVEDFGEAAFDHAVRQFAHRLRGTLPANAMFCRRSEGSYLAFLHESDLDFARAWANQVTAMAAMVALSTPDGKARIPLALRAKVSSLSKQSHQIIEPTTAPFVKS